MNKLQTLVEQARQELQEAAAERKLLKDLVLKDATVVPRGSAVTVEFYANKDEAGRTYCRLHVDYVSPRGRDFTKEALKCPIESLPTVVSGFKMPSEKTLEKWSFDGVAQSVTGKKVEPDGIGPDGAPSWLLVLGIL